jgi:hypothetical protein
VGLPDLKQPFVTGAIQTSTGLVPWIPSSLRWADQWGTIKARWGVGRMQYTVDPGLYGLGNPDDKSPVLVTANYKMSFDQLRAALPGRNAWIMVLNTEGINVWCAAGKGTFGTEELARRIALNKLTEVVSHRELILPQLSGPGIAAHEVKKITGFKVIYGPIRSIDLPSFLDAGLKATPRMRQKTFPVQERAALIPMELVSTMKWAVFILPLFFFLGGLGGNPSGFWHNALDHGLFAVLALLTAMMAGTILTPLLLPWLPGRAFSLKGAAIGLVSILLLTIFWTGHQGKWPNSFEILAWFFLVPGAAAFLAMNFTGASTYTSLSGVRKEMKWAVPLQIVAGVVGLGLWAGAMFLG